MELFSIIIIGSGGGIFANFAFDSTNTGGWIFAILLVDSSFIGLASFVFEYGASIEAEIRCYWFVIGSIGNQRILVVIRISILVAVVIYSDG